MVIPKPVQDILSQLDINADNEVIDDHTRKSCRKSARVIRDLYRNDKVGMAESQLDS